MTAKLTNFVFEIGNTLSISIVDLNTLVRMIIFYIIQVNILFLLYFINMDKLKTYFNNFINKVI